MTTEQIETAFIDAIIETELRATVFLTNGVKLNGIILDHDIRTLTLSRDGVTQLVYKNAIATIMPPIDNMGNK